MSFEEQRSHGHGTEEDCEEDEDKSGGEAESSAQDEAQVASRLFLLN